MNEQAKTDAQVKSACDILLTFGRDRSLSVEDRISALFAIFNESGLGLDYAADKAEKILKEILFSEKVFLKDKIKIGEFLLAFQGYEGSEKIRDELLRISTKEDIQHSLRIKAASAVLEDDIL